MEPEYRKFKFFPSEYTSFRSEIIDFLIKDILPNSKSILDPMAGTAPLLPYINLFNKKALFSDINPLHFYINRAKTYNCYISVSDYCKNDPKKINSEAFVCLKKLKNKHLLISDKWIPDEVLEILINAWEKSDYYSEQFSHLLKAIILLSIRPYSSFSRSAKNTTWFKPGGMTTFEELETIINKNVTKYWNFYTYYYSSRGTFNGTTSFNYGDAANICSKETFDTIISSPPYPNRYDFTVTFSPELYFLYKIKALNSTNELRNEMLASNSIKNMDLKEPFLPAQYCNVNKLQNFLKEVKKKGKPNENNYYYKYFLKYYSRLFKIIDAMVSRLKNSGLIILVVQNNIHRGELNSMDEFIQEYFICKGMKVEIAKKFPRSHQGKRNISADHPIVLQKHYESIIKACK